jgi:hypothetical protein
MAACSGGGVNGTPQTPSSNDSGSGTHPTGNVTFTVTIPKAQTSQSRRPKYVSPNTQSLVVQQLDTSTNHNPVGNPVIVNVTSTSNGCTTNSNGTTCSVTFGAPAGTFDFSVKAYDQTNGNGNLLSENTLTTYTVIAGQANTISVTLNGVIHSVSAPASISGTLSAPQVLNFTPEDASGATIIGPGTYDNGPLTITEQSGTVTISPSSFNGPGDGTSSTLQCKSPGNYTLEFADASGALGTMTYTCTASPISLNPGSLDFDAVAASQSDNTYDQPVFANDPNPSPNIAWNLNCTPSGTAIVLPEGSSAAIRPLTVGTCQLMATDQYGAPSQVINIEVHTTTITVQSRKHALR